MKKVILVFSIVSAFIGCTSSASSEKEVVSDSTIVVDSVKVDSVKQANKELDVKLSHVDTVVYSITKEITHVDKTIKELKQNTNEKVNNVDNHADSELSRLLSDRYNQ